MMAIKTRTYWLAGAAQMLLGILCLLYAAHSCDVAHAAVETNYDEEYENQPKLKDCQMFVVDESFLGKKYKRKQEVLVCRWEVQIGGDTLIFWKEPGTSRYGFTR